MMIDPPIDKLIEKVGSKYALVTLVTKRARYLIDKKADFVEQSGERVISLAARDVYNDVVKAENEE